MTPKAAGFFKNFGEGRAGSPSGGPATAGLNKLFSRGHVRFLGKRRSLKRALPIKGIGSKMHSMFDERLWLAWLVKARIIILTFLLGIELAIARLTLSPLPVRLFITSIL